MTSELRQYSQYKASGLSWLPLMPSHWELKRGKHLFRKMDRPVSERDKVVTCFRDGTVTLRSNRRERGFTEALKEIGYQGVRRGDLVIHAMDGFAGAIGVSDSDGKSSPVYAVCQPQASANAYFYAYLLRTMAQSGWILALAKGIRERSTDFRFSDFGSQFLPVPSEDEQSAIVRFLDHQECLIRRYVQAKERLIALVNEQKLAIVERIMTNGLELGADLKPTGMDWLGDIPSNWDVKRIKYLLREIDERSSTGQETLLSLRMHHGLVPFAEHFDRPPQTASTIGFKIVRPGQIVINRMQAGNGLIFPSHLTGLVSPDYSVFEPIGDVNVEFLGELFRSRKVRAKFRAESKGLGTGTSGFLRLYDDRLLAIRVPIPSRPLQDRIVQELRDRLKHLNAAIARAETELDLIREYKVRVITDIVTGKLDVREAAAKLPDPSDSSSRSMADVDEPADDTVVDRENELQPANEEAET